MDYSALTSWINFVPVQTWVDVCGRNHDYGMYGRISANSEEPYKSHYVFRQIQTSPIYTESMICEHSYVKTVEIVYFQAMYNIHNPKINK